MRAAQVLAAVLIAAMLWIILDMDTPTSGFIVAPRAPNERALAAIER